MKSLIRFFIMALIALPHALWAVAPLSGTAGSNLTAFNGSTGALNNNTWNQMINSRPAPAADFGNCNALILRCAQPKCATGGCVSMDIAYPIVYGCVMSTDGCKGHGEPLIQAIAAQIVANSTARANEQAAGAANAAADAIAAQSEQQMQQMQIQMQQIQAQMAQQNAQSAAAVQAALEEQKQLAATAAADAAAREAAARAATAAPAVNIEQAVNIGVSADILAREQASGKIMTQLENAEVALKTLQTTMRDTFDYAGCDRSGNNCTGPKRVKAFKDKASNFFDPYETVLDEVYDALIMAQSLGVDITDIYMMLNGSCNVWGKYLCERCSSSDTDHIDDKNGTYHCEKYGEKDYYWTVAKIRAADGTFKVAPRQEHCTLTQMLSSQDEVQQNWLEMGAGSSGGIRVACASDAIENSALFRNRKKQASIDIETLQRIINQDAPTRVKSGESTNWLTRYCSVSDDDIYKLQTLVQNKSLTTTGLTQICVKDSALGATQVAAVEESQSRSGTTMLDCTSSLSANTDACLCENSGGNWLMGCNCGIGKIMNYSTKKCELVTSNTNRDDVKYNPISRNLVTSTALPDNSREMKRSLCWMYGGTWSLSGICDCSKADSKNAVDCFRLNRI